MQIVHHHLAHGSSLELSARAIAVGREPALAVIHGGGRGCVLRSRFYLGLSGERPEQAVPDALGLNLLRHCYTEFTFLSRFLPSLYYGEHANGEAAPLPW